MQTLTRNLAIPWGEGVADVAKGCEGFSGADLEGLVRRAGYVAIKRDEGGVKVEDFVAARGNVRASVGDVRKYQKLKILWEGRV